MIRLVSGCGARELRNHGRADYCNYFDRHLPQWPTIPRLSGRFCRSLLCRETLCAVHSDLSEGNYTNCECKRLDFTSRQLRFTPLPPGTIPAFDQTLRRFPPSNPSLIMSVFSRPRLLCFAYARNNLRCALMFVGSMFLVGCGTTQQRTGTEQLLLSDSVDRTVDQLDLGVLSGRTVYLDTTYIRPVKGIAFVNSDYIISTLRHKLTTSGCLVQESRADADYVLEARVGALGTDSLEVTYGLPASNVLSQAATLMSSAPVVPTIPEMSVGKRNAAMSTSKIMAYAYHRETGTPVWQSGAAISKSDSKNTWILGAGPLQRGSIHDGAKFAGMTIRTPKLFQKSSQATETPDLTIADAHQFVHPAVLEQQLADAAEPESGVIPASHEETDDDSSANGK